MQLQDVVQQIIQLRLLRLIWRSAPALIHVSSDSRNLEIIDFFPSRYYSEWIARMGHWAVEVAQGCFCKDLNLLAALIAFIFFLSRWNWDY